MTKAWKSMSIEEKLEALKSEMEVDADHLTTTQSQIADLQTLVTSYSVALKTLAKRLNDLEENAKR